MAKKNKKNPVGRPSVNDCKRSYTISLRPSERGKLLKMFGSLTNAIKSLL